MSNHTEDSSQWVRRFHPAPNAPARLICFPHAGGSASYFFPVSSSLSPTIDVISLQYPGRQERHHEKCLDTIEELADRITVAIRPWIDRPVAFFGHSMGAVLAFEVALRLKAEEIVPTWLFASGRRAPSTKRSEAFHRLPHSEFVDELRGLDGTESSLLEDADLLQMILPSLRSDYRAIETYEHNGGEKVDSPIVALLGDNDVKATVAEVTIWEQHTTSTFELKLYPGGHFYLNTHAAKVISLIADYVAGSVDELKRGA